MNLAYLSVIVFLPLLAALVVALLARSERQIRLTAAFFTLAAFAMSLALLVAFNRSPDALQFQFGRAVDWIPAINAHYHLAVDGLSLPMVVLTTFLGFLAVLVSWKVRLRVREYFIWLLVLETGILGVFTALDMLLFFLFWEVELIPMYMLISIWGSGRKEYSATKFVLYTLMGSAMMLAGILLLYFNTDTWSMTELAGTFAQDPQVLWPIAAFVLIFVGFAIKLPMFPFHTWLPDAHTDAPTAVSVILAGVLLKMGGYGMIRLSVSIFPWVAKQAAPYLVALAVVSVLYGAAVTLRQTDLKRLIAYSSISHMGYVLLGIFALSQVSLTGATLQMFSHGIITGLLFAMVGLVYDKSHERRLPALGGLARQMPIIAVVFSVAGLASLGLPTTSGFAAEFLVFLGSFTSPMVAGIKLYTILGVAGIVITAGYILWMLQRVFYTEPRERFDGVPDADGIEMACIFSLVAAIMLIGVYPRLLTDVIKVGISPIVGFLGL